MLRTATGGHTHTLGTQYEHRSLTAKHNTYSSDTQGNLLTERAITNKPVSENFHFPALCIAFWHWNTDHPLLSPCVSPLYNAYQHVMITKNIHLSHILHIFFHTHILHTSRLFYPLETFSILSELIKMCELISWTIQKNSNPCTRKIKVEVWQQGTFDLRREEEMRMKRGSCRTQYLSSRTPSEVCLRGDAAKEELFTA